MKATTRKAVFAAMSPSPVFEAIAEFAELQADHRRGALPKQIDDSSGFPALTSERSIDAAPTRPVACDILEGG
jgi:hypothetical protein